MILLDMEMPKNCVECDKIGIRAILECRLIFSGCANCGRHPNCPIKAEIPKNATNGDVIKAIFPQFDVNEEWKATRHFEFKSKECIEITGIATSDWWNAPWKGQENDSSNL